MFSAYFPHLFLYDFAAYCEMTTGVAMSGMTPTLENNWNKRTPHIELLKRLMETQVLVNMMPMRIAWSREAQSCSLMQRTRMDNER